MPTTPRQGVLRTNGAKLRRRVYEYGFAHPRLRRMVVDQFHLLFYGSPRIRRPWADTYWLGTPAQKCPLDLWIYQEILAEVGPDLIIETGTADGGSALYLASICDLLNKGRVVTIDIAEKPSLPTHPRVTYLVGSSTSTAILDEVRGLVRDASTVMVILDSDHRKHHVLAELQAYSDWVSPGSYLVVEDTNINGHPVARGYGPGPMEAVAEFLERNTEFHVDPEREKYYLTFNPGGYLRRKCAK